MLCISISLKKKNSFCTKHCLNYAKKQGDQIRPAVNIPQNEHVKSWHDLKEDGGLDYAKILNTSIVKKQC